MGLSERFLKLPRFEDSRFARCRRRRRASCKTAARCSSCPRGGRVCQGACGGRASCSARGVLEWKIEQTAPTWRRRSSATRAAAPFSPRRRQSATHGDTNVFLDGWRFRPGRIKRWTERHSKKPVEKRPGASHPWSCPRSRATFSPTTLCCSKREASPGRWERCGPRHWRVSTTAVVWTSLRCSSRRRARFPLSSISLTHTFGR